VAQLQQPQQTQLDQFALHTPDYYQQQPQQTRGQSGLGISQLGSMPNMLRGNPTQQMQRQNTYQNPYQSQLQAAQQFNMQRANMGNQQQQQLAQQYQQYQRQQRQMAARRAVEQEQYNQSYDPYNGGGTG
jgi:hypothetical protein